MKLVSRTLLIVSLLVAIVPQAYATCEPDLTIDPDYEEILFDTKFNGNCADWVKTGSATRTQVGSNWLIEFNGTGTLTQTQVAGNYTNGMYMAYTVYVVPGTAGTERLYAEIVQGTQVQETVGIYSPSDTSPILFNNQIGNYSNTAVSVRFRFVPGASPGTTKFRVDNVQLWGYF